ncbi:putative Transducin/WD40 repeat-like superfamily protein [Quillaja saponaria]|nr:putative Transducin/WD40 repeat-like superfamily protein [Quillaja saponaria]
MAPNAGCLLAICTVEGRVKIYRPPFCDFSAEWIEVLDITERLYENLLIIRFGDSDTPSLNYTAGQATDHTGDISNTASRKERKKRKVNKGSRALEDQLSLSTNYKDAKASSFPYSEIKGPTSNMVAEINSNLLGNASRQIVSDFNHEVEPQKEIVENDSVPLIAADQYASRSAILCSLVVAWSPVLHTSKLSPVPNNGTSISLLAVGGKSGNISFWKFHAPDSYTIECGRVLNSAKLIGLLQAHNSWITGISWAVLASDSANPQILLVTGSSDGSVRIWVGDSDVLLNSSDMRDTLFFLLKEVIIVGTAPVSALSVVVPAHSMYTMLLAVGKGSGSFEVWNCDISCHKFDNFGSYNAGSHVVSGLVWAFDGSCLYSCSQDNFVLSWILRGSCLYEEPISSNTIHDKSLSQLPKDLLLSSCGVAVSPGSLVVATVHSLDSDQLDPMYEGRTHKAAVQYLWIGGKQVDFFSKIPSTVDIENFGCSPEKELTYWESNIVWSLKQYEYLDKPLVVWDIIAALLAFKKSESTILEVILIKWLSISFMGSHVGLHAEEVLSRVSTSLSESPSRHLHLLNIICRRVILSDLEADQINSKVHDLQGLCPAEGKHLTKWIEILMSSETELRERLVSFSFSAFLSLTSYSDTSLRQPGYWYPVGLAQMKHWVGLNDDHVRDQVKVLASEFGIHERSGYLRAEHCSYCSAPVSFESPEVGFCQGEGYSSGGYQSHRLSRCAVSMQVCPATPLWFCICCHRWVYRLAPETLFTMSAFPLDLKSSTESTSLAVSSKPLCPFCGILLQRRQPDFLLSSSPV